jgi:hypothetical protein
LSDRVLRPRAAEFAEMLAYLTYVPDNNWQMEYEDAERARQSEKTERQEKDRRWLAEHAELVRSGTHQRSLIFGAELALGLRGRDNQNSNDDTLTAWFGAEGATNIRTGWTRVAADYPITVAEQGRAAGLSQHYRLNVAAVAHLEQEIALDLEVDMSVPFAFAALCGSLTLQKTERRDAVVGAAVDRILADVEGKGALMEFWTEAMRVRGRDLPYLSALEAQPNNLGVVLERLLRRRPTLRHSILRSAIRAALRCLTSDVLADLAQNALTRPLPFHAQRIWKFVDTPRSFGRSPLGRNAGLTPLAGRRIHWPAAPTTHEWTAQGHRRSSRRLVRD